MPCFVVSGELVIVQRTDTAGTLIVRYHRGQFSNEASTLSGLHAVARVRVSAGGHEPT